MNRFIMQRFLVLFLVLGLITACSDDDPVDPGDPADTQKPSVEIVKPSIDEVIPSDDLEVEVVVGDNVGVERVDLYLNNSLSPDAVINGAPWTTTVSIAALENGDHLISAKAYDAAGNESNVVRVAFIKQKDDGIHIVLKPGSEFVFDRWELDMENEKDPASNRDYVTRIVAGDGSMLDGKTDWVYQISEDMRDGDIDTMLVRISDAGNVQVYGFSHMFLDLMLAKAEENGYPLTMPDLDDPVWEDVARFYDAASAPLQIGSTWEITQPGGIVIDIIQGVSAVITVKGAFTGKDDIFNVGGKDINGWKSTITATISIMGTDSDVLIHLWFSDDPDGQVRMQHESSEINMVITTFPVNGDLQELKSYQQ